MIFQGAHQSAPAARLVSNPPLLFSHIETSETRQQTQVVSCFESSGPMCFPRNISDRTWRLFGRREHSLGCVFFRIPELQGEDVKTTFGWLGHTKNGAQQKMFVKRGLFIQDVQDLLGFTKIRPKYHKNLIGQKRSFMLLIRHTVGLSLSTERWWRRETFAFPFGAEGLFSGANC